MEQDQQRIINLKKQLDFDFELLSTSLEKKIYIKAFRYEFEKTLSSMFFSIVITFNEYIHFPDDKKATWNIIHDNVEYFVKICCDEIELCEFLYLTVEKHTEKDGLLQGFPFIKGVLGVRSLGCSIDKLKMSLREILSHYISGIKINSLSTLKKVHSWLSSVLFQNNFKFHRCCCFSDFFYPEFAGLTELELSLRYKECYLGGGLYNTEAKFSDVRGLKTQKTKKYLILLFLIKLYLDFKNIKICNNNFYSKIEESRFSWKLLDSIDFLKKNNISILQNLMQKFPQQLKFLDYEELVIQSFDFIFQKLKKNNNLLSEIRIDDKIIEFADGLYFVSFNFFLSFLENEEIFKKVKMFCCYYFNTTYVYCVSNMPLQWISILEKNVTSIHDFIFFLGNLFHSKKIIETKKDQIFWHIGDINENSLKVLVSFNETSKDFFFVFKKKIIFNDFKLKQFKDINSVTFVFEKNINKSFLTNYIFLYKLIIYAFTIFRTNSSFDVLKKLNNEFPQILLYCNKAFFKKHKVIEQLN